MIEKISSLDDITVELINSMIAYLNQGVLVTWLPILIAFFALVVSIISLLCGNASRKDVALQNIKMNIDNAKSQYENVSMELTSLGAKKNRNADEDRELELKKKIADSAFEKVLNAYEDGCSKYFRKKVNQKEFENKYNMDIINYIQKFTDYFKEPETHYNSMLEYHKKNFKKY